MNKPIIRWLYMCCFMVFAMAVIGAVTRLTESGLSITEWKPVSGALPPLTDEAWQRAYDLYRASPEFAAKHNWMSIEDYKKIFFWEWLHRLWGRSIGIVYALPLLWFAIRKQIPQGYGWKLLGILALGGMQGVVGWWMVASGLVDRPSVSHFRLATHLGLALVIFASMWWVILDLKNAPASQLARRGLFYHAIAALVFLAITITWGAFVAGLDAGLVYNTFPLMNGNLTPSGSADIFNEHGWVQFTHRYLAITTFLMLMALSVHRKDIWLGVMACAQVMLGISTLLLQVPVTLAALHQAGAIILLALTIRAVHRLKSS